MMKELPWIKYCDSCGKMLVWDWINKIWICQECGFVGKF